MPLEKELKGEDKVDPQVATIYRIAEIDGPSKVYTCTLCDGVYKNRNYFTQHYRHVHLKMRKKTFPCVLCKAQILPWHRARHMEEFHGWPAPTCDACGKKFNYANEVLKHQKLYHMGEKNFKCHICGKTFGFKKGLNNHLTSHSDARAFKCDYCPKAFKTKIHLQTHTRIHLNDRRFVCSICDEAFVQGSSLKYHLAKRHPEAL